MSEIMDRVLKFKCWGKKEILKCYKVGFYLYKI